MKPLLLKDLEAHSITKTEHTLEEWKQLIATLFSGKAEPETQGEGSREEGAGRANDPTF